MKAIVHEGKVGLDGLSIKEIQEPSLDSNQVKVKIITAGLNRRDLSVVTKRHGAQDPLLVPGSDAAGIVEAVGEGVTRFKAGDEVVVNPGTGWEKNSDSPPEGFEIVGFPDQGTFAEYICQSEKYVEHKPAHLDYDQAGVLGLAGLTAYRALFTRGKLTKDQTLLLPGIGSGVLTFALKFAKAKGARVIVTSRSDAKRKEALSLGADRAIDTHSDWNEELANESVDLLLESVGAATFNQSLDIIRKGGTIVTFGATTEDEVTINIRKFFYGQYNLLGSTMGSAEEFKEMIDFVATHHIIPQLDRVFSYEEYLDTFKYIEESKNFGKIAISFASL